MIYKIYFFVSVIFRLTIFLSTNYIHLELDGDLISQETTNFSLFVKHFKGIVFYGIDRSNKVLIELEEEKDEKRILFKFNNILINEKSRNLCGCPKCSDVYMTFILQLDRSQIAVKCNNQTQTLQVDRSKSKILKPDQFDNYPVPNMYNREKKVTYIFMGNIGPYKGPNYMEYLPLYNQLIGCLDKFYFNGKLIRVTSNRTKFKSFCPTEYIETVHSENFTTKFTVSYDIPDCSISSLNTRYCIRNLSIFNLTTSKTPLKFAGKHFFIRLDWIVSIRYQNLCLMEIFLNDGSTIIFYVENAQNLVVQKVYKNGTFSLSKILETLDTNSTYTMIANFTETKFIVRLSSKEDISTFIQHLNNPPVSINIGISRTQSICKTFEGFMDFQYKILYSPNKMSSTPSLKPTTALSSRGLDKIKENITSTVQYTTIVFKKDEIKITSANIIFITISVFLVFIFLLLLFYIIIRKEMRSHIRKISFGTMSAVDPSQSENIRNPRPNVYEYEFENVYVSSRDSGGYEILPENV